jgi:hypothetical protein
LSRAAEEVVLDELQVRVAGQDLVIDVAVLGVRRDDQAGDPESVAVLVHRGRHHVIVEAPQSSQARKIAVESQSGLSIAALMIEVT